VETQRRFATSNRSAALQLVRQGVDDPGKVLFSTNVDQVGADQ
jgi:hypothetical protein